MRSGKGPGVGVQLEAVRRRFERWRRAHRPRARIPARLWAAAVTAAGTYGICRTSKVLRLSYYSLKDRVERQGNTPAVVRGRTAADPRQPTNFSAGAAPLFVELSPVADQGFAGSPWGRCECLVEWKDPEGATMRMHLKAEALPDLPALSRSFWNPAP